MYVQKIKSTLITLLVFVVAGSNVTTVFAETVELPKITETTEIKQLKSHQSKNK